MTLKYVFVGTMNGSMPKHNFVKPQFVSFHDNNKKNISYIDKCKCK